MQSKKSFKDFSISELERLNTEANYFGFFRRSTPHQRSWDSSKKIYDKIQAVVKNEELIQEDRALYLFTWAPNPSELPNCDFETQHKYNLPYISEYLMNCSCGIACVESSQLGNPHYHGWYQLSDDPVKEQTRIVLAKCLAKFGLIKITASKGHYKIGSWCQHANCLYYYKKDLIQTQLLIEDNPVLPKEYPRMDTNDYHFNSFFKIEGKRQSIADLEDRVSLRDFYRDFYKQSL